MKSIPITDISGFQIGYADNAALGTGCTAILCRAGAVAGCDVRGGGPATRDTDLLAPKNTVEAIHGVLLSGGSAFGLEAGTGVMKYLSEQGIGMPVTPGVSVPIVVQADIFDLAVGDPAWPDVAMGYAAAKDSAHNVIRHGNAGAGMGASVGKILGPEKAMKSGIGTAAFECGPLKVGAVVVVNACGDVFAMDSDTRLAGVQSDQSMEEIMGMLYETEAARAMEQAQDAEASRKKHDHWLCADQWAVHKGADEQTGFPGAERSVADDPAGEHDAGWRYAVCDDHRRGAGTAGCGGDDGSQSSCQSGGNSGQ